uniref:Uncharacterized protein n=1 Tax=Tanacetum cinerariifolium TaxID=118510 RepID=A0A699JSW2_TANCI|nr:hypothetical protein [Tanacetum cinerariifolium]
MDTTIDQQVAMDEAFVPPDIPEIYMQEFRATATVHHHAIRFNMDDKKHIMNLESFRDMLHICPRIPAIINKYLTGKSFSYDSLRLSQAQILWGLYHERNVDYAYLMWEDFVYQVEHKNQKKSNEMYYPWFTKVRIHHFMSKDPSIPRRNKVNWHYVRDDFMFSTIKLRSSSKPKASARRARSGSNTSITPPTVAASPRLTASAKGKQTAKVSKAKSLSVLSEVAMTEAQQLKLATKRSRQQMHISQASSFGTDEGTDEGADEEEKDDDDDENDEGDDGEEGDGKEGDSKDDNDEDDDDEEGNDDEQEVVRDVDKKDAEESGDDDKEEGEGDEQESDEETRDEECKTHMKNTINLKILQV